MTTVFSQALDTNGTGAENYSIRTVCRNMNGAGNSVTVTFNGSTAGTFTVDNASIGIQSSQYNTVSTPVELKFSGVSGFSLSAGSSITSDAATLTVARGDSIVVVMDLSATGGNGRRTNAYIDQVTRYYKTSTNSYADASPTGTWTNDNFCFGVVSIAISGAVNDTTLFTQTLTTNGTGGENVTYRVICPSMASGGSQLRVVFRGHTFSPFSVDNASVGIQSSGGDTTATPTELLFGGVSGFTAGADQAVISDLTTFSYSASDNLIVTYDVSATNGNPRGTASAGTRYYKVTYNSYNVQSISGLGFSNDTTMSSVWLIQAPVSASSGLLLAANPPLRGGLGRGLTGGMQG